MKKRLTLSLTLVLCLLLCACSRESAPATQPVETQQNASAEITEEGYHVQEKTMEDGTLVTVYRNGGPDGTIVKGFINYPNGAKEEEYYNSEGILEHLIYMDVDGSVYESYFYPSGSISKDIIMMADGSYTEVHFLDNGAFDEETGTFTSGTICYEKYVTADGQITENTYDIALEDDGTWWSTNEWEDGTIVKTCHSADGRVVTEIQTNEATGDHTEIQYYENGNEKARNSYYASHEMSSFIEYYENGSVKYSLMEYNDGSKVEEKLNEAGYTTYYYCFGSTVNWEFFANDTGDLVKYVEDGTVYEGEAIPSQARDTFNQIRQVPVEDTVTTQGEDGSSSTTFTYADGSTTTSGVTADGYAFYELISANGDETYEEYYPNGKLKHMISKNGDMFQEVYCDEDGYYTYFHMIVPGYEQEITTDETGKVNKVLVNGVEQTNIEDIVKDMFFRSW